MRQQFCFRFFGNSDYSYSELVEIEILQKNTNKPYHYQHSNQKHSVLILKEDGQFSYNIIIGPLLQLVNCLPYPLGYTIISSNNKK